MKVSIPGPLLSYTNQCATVEANGETVAELLKHLDQQFPGLRFRMIDEQNAIRTHMRIFVNGEMITSLTTRLTPSDDVYILQSLSGG